jgi:hypothetical protein
MYEVKQGLVTETAFLPWFGSMSHDEKQSDAVWRDSRSIRMKAE